MTHNIMKRTLAGVLAVLCVASYLPANVGTGGFIGGTSIVASAEDDFANVSTAAELITAFKTGGNYKLTAHIALESTVDVDGADVTLDLNGQNITATGFRAFNVKAGSLTLTGTGTVSSTGDKLNADSSVIRVGDGFYESDGTGETPASLTVDKDVTISTDKSYGISVFGRKTAETLNVYGKVNVTSERNAISGNGTSGLGSTVINIYPGAEVTSTGDVAIYHPQAGTLNITGGTIRGLGGIEAKAGTSNVSISGTSTSITATGTVSHTANGNGTSTRGYAVAAVENSGYVGNPQINISGGTITGEVGLLKDNAVADEKKGAISITGGTFSTDVSDYVDEGYMQNEQGTVIAKSAYDWVLTESKTYTLEEDMICNSITSANGVNATIDLNGHNIVISGYLSAGDYSTSKDNASTLSIVNSGTAATITTGYQTFIDPYSTLNLGDKVTLASAAQINVSDNSTLTIGAGATASSNTTWTIVPCANATVNVSGTIENTNDGGYAITGNHNWSQDSVINIYNGAYVESTNGVAIYHPQDGELNIEGGTITGKTALYARTGTVNISGGTFNGTGAKADQYLIADGAEATGDAVVFQSFTTSYGHAPYVTITGGTFNSTNAAAIATYEAGTADAGVAPVGFITGGRFSTTVNTLYIADGYAQDKESKEVEKIEAEAQRCTVTTYFANNAPVNSVIYPKYYVSGDYTVPENVYLDGYDFDRWEIIVNGITHEYNDRSDAQNYVDNLLGLGEDITVKAIYDKHIEHCDIYLNNGSFLKGDSYAESYTVVKVKADEPQAGKVFSHWVRSDNGGEEQIVSYNAEYAFYAPSDGVHVELTAVYANAPVEAKGTGFIESVKRPAYNKMAFVSVLNVPDGCKMLKAGVVVQSKEALNGAELTKANAKAVRYTDTSKNNYKTFKYTWSLTTNNISTEWTVRPYLEYKDKKGNVQVVYGDAVTKSIDNV